MLIFLLVIKIILKDRTDISKKQKRFGLRASISMNMKVQRKRGNTLEKIKRKNFKDLKSNK